MNTTNSLSYQLKNIPILNCDKNLINCDKKIIGLSGASGFLGLHLIEQLVKNENISEIKCFIRNKKKFIEKKEQFNLSFPEEKLQFFETIEEKDFKNITNFIHSAAYLHNLKKLNSLWKDNVDLTEKFLSLVKGKFHYISTLSVFASSNIKGRHLPQYITSSENHELYGGYAQSKWLGEFLTMKHPEHQILRLGLLTPSKSNPHIQQDQFLYIFFKLLTQLKVFPHDYEEAFVDFSPVDMVAKSIINSLDEKKTIKHIANKKSTSLSNILKFLDIQEISNHEWQEKIKNLKTIEHILLQYAFFKSESLIKYPQYFNIDLFQSTNHDWQSDLEDDNILEEYLKVFK